MPVQSFQIVPDGVTQAQFAGHTHNYRKITRLGVDTKKDWTMPAWSTVGDDQDSVAAAVTDIEAAGLTAATSATGIPN